MSLTGGWGRACGVTEGMRSSLGEGALKYLNAIRALPVNPVFEDEKSNGQTKNDQTISW